MPGLSEAAPPSHSGHSGTVQAERAWMTTAKGGNPKYSPGESIIRDSKLCTGGHFVDIVLGLLTAATTGCQAPSFYGGYVRTTPRFEAVDTGLSGVSLGLQEGLGKLAGFLEVRATSDPDIDLDLVEMIAGIRVPAWSTSCPGIRTERRTPSHTIG